MVRQVANPSVSDTTRQQIGALAGQAAGDTIPRPDRSRAASRRDDSEAARLLRQLRRGCRQSVSSLADLLPADGPKIGFPLAFAGAAVAWCGGVILALRWLDVIGW